MLKRRSRAPPAGASAAAVALEARRPAPVFRIRVSNSSCRAEDLTTQCALWSSNTGTPRSLLEMRNLGAGPAPDLLDQNLYFNKIHRRFMCT